LGKEYLRCFVPTAVRAKRASSIRATTRPSFVGGASVLDPRCKHRFTSTSGWNRRVLFVVKKDGRREQYTREKILGRLRKACEKRPISESQMEGVAADLERELFAAAKAKCRRRWSAKKTDGNRSRN